MMDGPSACPRCGTFAELRRWIGRDWCRKCYERLQPAKKTGLVRPLARDTWRVTRRIALPAALVMLVAASPYWFLSGMPPGALRTTLHGVWFFAMTPAWLVVLDLALQARLSPTRVRLASALDRIPRLSGRLLVLRLVKWLQIIGAGLACGVPGLVRALSLFVAEPALVAGGEGVFAALEESSRRMRGHRIAVLALAWLLWLPQRLATVLIVVVGQEFVDLGAPLEGVRTAVRASAIALPVLLLPLAVLQMVTWVRLAPAPSWGEKEAAGEAGSEAGDAEPVAV